MMSYKFHLHQESVQKASTYLAELKSGKQTAGVYLAEMLSNKALSDISLEAFIERLVWTKRPQIFAESEISGDGTDWNQAELSVLGDIGVSVPVTIYDNGRHANPQVHPYPFEGTLLYIPGALLRNDRGGPPADWGEVVEGDQVSQSMYTDLYERRLLPLFRYINDICSAQNQTAFVTIPGLGCGQFAGRFRKTLESNLKMALLELITNHCRKLPFIRAVYYDPYRHGENERYELGQISFLVRPLLKGNEHKPQLCTPQTYAEDNDEFSNCSLFSFVAWDHVSWPGNDFYLGSRTTDDGVKAAATSSMAEITGIEGVYDPQTYTYAPPSGYRNWNQVVVQNRNKLEVQKNLIIHTP
jgi:hypothetical protein